MSDEQKNKDASKASSNEPQLKRARTGTSPIRIEAGGNVEASSDLPDFVAGTYDYNMLSNIMIFNFRCFSCQVYKRRATETNQRWTCKYGDRT